MDTFGYVYNWSNNEKRKTMKGRKCKIVSFGKMNSIEIEFENGQREIVSRMSIRRGK